MKDNQGFIVMSYNIRCMTEADKGKRSFEVRRPLILKMIEKIHPDILGMEEVKPIQYEYLKTNLIDYDSVIVYRDDSPYAEGTPIFFLKDKFELIKEETFWLSKTPDVMSGSWKTAFFRIATYVILKVKETSKELLVLSTHLDNASRLARRKGSKLIVARLSGIPLPQIVMGDFNSFPISAPYFIFSKAYKDAAKSNLKMLNKKTFNNYGDHLPINVKIDYIFYSKEFIAHNYMVDDETFQGIYPSDHYPIYTTLSFKHHD